MPLTSHLGSFGQAFWSMVSDPYQKVTYCFFFLSLILYTFALKKDQKIVYLL